MNNVSPLKKRRNQRDLRYPIFNRHLFVELREAMQLSRDEMATMLSESVRTIGAWETGEVMPTSKKTEKVAKALFVPLSKVSMDREVIYKLHEEQMRIEELVRLEFQKDVETLLKELQNKYNEFLIGNDEAFVEKLMMYGIDSDPLVSNKLEMIAVMKRIVLMTHNDILNTLNNKSRDR